MDLSTALRSRGPNAGTPTDGSRTMTITRDPTKEHPDSDENEEQGPGGQAVGTLHLRGARRPTNRPRVAWNEDVIDNEGCGKKKSKTWSSAVRVLRDRFISHQPTRPAQPDLFAAYTTNLADSTNHQTNPTPTRIQTLPAPETLPTTTRTTTTTTRTTTTPLRTQAQARNSPDRMEDPARCTRLRDPSSQSPMRMRSSQRENEKREDG
ncbi:hypothetical protein D9613_012433 [Agrocybe pediades]|uniref:Uncharacterized protein n=1 Tax=Agrocybe pediades TaxID=84607 RepID=A0A8H4QRE6_9AGAR|nr:hypothetical protein D9613_012433 [Agrocybe pediades]